MGGVFECSNGITVQPAKQWYEVMVEADNDRELLEISKREKPKSDQRPTGLKKTFLNIEKVFLGARKHH